MEWTIFLTIGVIITFFAGIIKPVLKLNTSITTLNCTISNLTNEMKENKESHEEIWEKENEQDRTLSDHETRLTVIEKRQ